MDAGARLTATLGPSAFFLSSCSLITVTSSTSVKPKVLAGMLDIAQYGLFMVRSLPARRGSPVAGVIDHQRRARIAGLVADRGGRHRKARWRATGSRNRKGVLAAEVARHGCAKTGERRCVGAP